MRKIFLVFLVAWFAIFSYAPVASAAADPERADAVSAVETLLKESYSAYQTLPKTLRFSLVEQTDSLYRYEQYIASNIDHMRVHGLEFSDSSFSLRKTSVTIDGDSARVNTTVDLDYHYSFAPKTASAIHNMEWSLGLKKRGGVWRVSSLNIEGLNCFSSFRDKIDARKASGLPYTQIVDEVVALRHKQTRDIHAALKKTTRSAAVPDASAGENETSYDRKKAVRYASIYSIRPAGSRLYSKMDSDCTNFVSACIWAGYGGWNEEGGNHARINARLFMTPEWFGSIPGGRYPAGAWMRVEELWDYLVSEKTVGPIATGYNDGERFEKMTQRLQPGDIIQFYKYKKYRYGHSMFVSVATKDPYIGNAARVLLSGHTGDTKNRPLVDFLFNYDGLYGEAPKTRLLVPQPAKF